MHWVLKTFINIGAVFFVAQAYAGVLVVNIEGIKRHKGVIRVALWDKPENFLKMEEEAAVHYRVVKVDKSRVTVRFENLERGVYSMGIFHDKNNNGKLDYIPTTIAKAPAEPYGFANNAVGFFGPPKYKKTTFTIKQGSQEMTVKLRGE